MGWRRYRSLVERVALPSFEDRKARTGMPTRLLAALFAPPTKYAAATGAMLATVVGVERWWFVPGALLLALLFFQTVEFTTYALLSFRERQVWAWRMRHHVPTEGEGEGRGQESFGIHTRSSDSGEHYREMTFRVGSKVMTWALWVCALGLDGIMHFTPEVIPAVDFPLLARNEFLPLTITATVMLVVMEIGRIADNAARYQGAGGDAWIIRKMLGLFPWMLPRVPQEEESPPAKRVRRRTLQ